MSEVLSSPLRSRLAKEWCGLDDVEFATLEYVDWFNHHRLHGEITDDASYTTPAESESPYYGQNGRPPRPSPNSPSSHQTRGGSLVG